MISLATSKVTQAVRDNIEDCLNENRIGQGRFNKEFEDRVAAYMGVKHAIAVCNGSMADIVALGALKAKYPDKDEVIVPAYTFIAQTNAILINGLKPVFVDVEKCDFQLNHVQVEKAITDKTLCIFPVHLFGRDCYIDALLDIAIDYDLPVVEDCCEAYGGQTETKQKFGTFGDFGTFSFFPSHTITTGEGGIIITDDDELSGIARQVANHGRRGNNILDKFHFDVFGYNGKMSNVLASIGCAVVDSADEVIEKRQKNVDLYNKLLNKYWYAESPHCYPVVCESEIQRNTILQVLESNGIEARKAFSCLPTQEKVYANFGGKYPIAEELGKVALFVPVHQDLSEKDIIKICNVIKKCL